MIPGKKIICVVGMTGSGKSEASDYLVKRGLSYLRFGQITLDAIKEKGLEVSEENEKKIREGFREEHGMAAFAILNISRIDALLEKSDVVADGLYSWSEYKVLKEKYGEKMKVLAVYAPPEIRYERLEKRSLEKSDKEKRFRPLTKEQARARDYAEIENIEKGGPIVMADHTLINTGTLQDLESKIDEWLK